MEILNEVLAFITTWILPTATILLGAFFPIYLIVLKMKNAKADLIARAQVETLQKAENNAIECNAKIVDIDYKMNTICSSIKELDSKFVSLAGYVDLAFQKTALSPEDKEELTETFKTIKFSNASDLIVSLENEKTKLQETVSELKEKVAKSPIVKAVVDVAKKKSKVPRV